ncbi:MAG: response regulator [Williamsia sp.]|nr:response regulator [Williamsia sp.]
MNKRPIIIIEDDIDDQEIITQVLESLNISNKPVFFNNGKEALDFLQKEDVHPFVILSDINMPVMNGFELRMRIAEDMHLRNKSIPFVFYTTAADQKSVSTAYDLTVQGFFIKPPDISSLTKILKSILEYWKYCMHPNTV